MQQMHYPSITKVNKYFLIVLGVGFLLQSISSNFLGTNLFPIFGLSASGVLSGKIWQFVTYTFFPRSIMEFIFEALIFWFIGSELERMWGVKRYLSFLATVSLAGGLIYFFISLILKGSIVFQLSLVGASALSSTLAVAYGILFPDRTMFFFFFPLQAKWFVILLIGMNLYQGIFSPMGVLAWSQLAHISCGYLWMIWISKRQFIKFKAPKKSHLRVVPDDEDDNKPTFH